MLLLLGHVIYIQRATLILGQDKQQQQIKADI